MFRKLWEVVWYSKKFVYKRVCVEFHQKVSNFSSKFETFGFLSNFLAQETLKILISKLGKPQIMNFQRIFNFLRNFAIISLFSWSKKPLENPYF